MKISSVTKKLLVTHLVKLGRWTIVAVLEVKLDTN